MTALQTAESTLLHKLCDDLRAAVPQLGTPTYEATSVARMVLSGNGKSFTYRLSVTALTAVPLKCELESRLWEGEQQVHGVGWIKTEDSVTKILGLVKFLVTKFIG